MDRLRAESAFFGKAKEARNAMDTRNLMQLRPTEGITTSQAAAVMKDVVVDDFA